MLRFYVRTSRRTAVGVGPLSAVLFGLLAAGAVLVLAVYVVLPLLVLAALASGIDWWRTRRRAKRILRAYLAEWSAPTLYRSGGIRVV